MGAIVLNGAVLEAGCLVGAGALVTGKTVAKRLITVVFLQQTLQFSSYQPQFSLIRRHFRRKS